MARAAASASELDVFDSQPEPEPEPVPVPGEQAVESWEDGKDFAPPPVQWDVGTVYRGVVSFWEFAPGTGGYGMILKMGKPEIVSNAPCTRFRSAATV